jgi:hypothetical protein
MRLFALVVALAVVSALPQGARAETLGAWTFTAPAGFKAESAKGRRSFTRVEGAAFCLVGVYEPRAATHDVAADLRKEWTEVIEAQFAASDVNGYPPKQTKQNLNKHTIGARLRSGQQEFYGQLVIVRGNGMVGSVVIMAANANGIAACHPAANTVLDSIVVAGATTSAVTTTQVTSVLSEATLVGTWSASTSARDSATNASLGSQIRQYVFKPDGTYTFKLEQWGGHVQKPQWYIVEEAGVYKVDGPKVTVTPKSASGVTKDEQGAVIKKSKVKLEKVTYDWQMHYFEGIRENQLVLTPPKQTARDGAIGNNSQFPKSALYSAQYQPQWRYP